VMNAARAMDCLNMDSNESGQQSNGGPDYGRPTARCAGGDPSARKGTARVWPS
jgi:hypothetical protein